MTACQNDSPRTYAGVPIELRRAQRRRRLLDAGLEQIGTRGYDHVSVKDVCRGAGLTERYFYEHFSDRHALLVAVYDDVITAVMGASFAAAESAPATLADQARAGITAFIDALAADPRRAKIQLVESVGRSDELDRRRREVMHAFAAYLARSSARLHPRPDVPPRQRDALALAVVGATDRLAVEWVLGDLGLSREELIDTLVSMLLAVADAPAAGPGPDGVGAPEPACG